MYFKISLTSNLGASGRVKFCLRLSSAIFLCNLTVYFIVVLLLFLALNHIILPSKFVILFVYIYSATKGRAVCYVVKSCRNIYIFWVRGKRENFNNKMLNRQNIF